MRAALVVLLLLGASGCRDGGKTAAKTAATKTAKTAKTATGKPSQNPADPPEGKTPIDIEPLKTGAKKPAPKQTEVPLKDPEGKGPQ